MAAVVGATNRTIGASSLDSFFPLAPVPPDVAVVVVVVVFVVPLPLPLPLPLVVVVEDEEEETDAVVDETLPLTTALAADDPGITVV